VAFTSSERKWLRSLSSLDAPGSLMIPHASLDRYMYGSPVARDTSARLTDLSLWITSSVVITAHYPHVAEPVKPYMDEE
jgi:hypothetical protein